jgi:hypothetical protein
VSSGLFWLGVSIFVIFQALKLGHGEFSNPGSGFVLFWSSLAFGALSIVLIVKSSLGRNGRKSLLDAFRGLQWSHAIITVVAVVLYAAVMARLGFLLSTFALMVLLFRLGKIKLGRAIVSALVTIMVTYIVFHFALEIHFPKGVLPW